MTCRLGNRPRYSALYSLILHSLIVCSTSSASIQIFLRILAEERKLTIETLYYRAASVNVLEIYMDEVKHVNVLVERRVGSMQASWPPIIRAILAEGEIVGSKRTLARAQWF